MFVNSIRWRLQLWLAFLLLCVLSGFGITAYQLHKVQRFQQLDEALEDRLTALSAAVRRPPFFGGRRGGPPRDSFESGREGARDGGPGPRPFEEGPRKSPPPHDHDRDRGGGPFGGGPFGPGFGPREVQLSSDVQAMFDRGGTNDFYFTIWARGGAELKRSTNCPAGVPLPERVSGDTRTHTRMRGDLREAYLFTELGDFVLAGRSITAEVKSMERYTGWLVIAGCAVLALGLGGGWRLTSSALRPVDQISSAASRISAGNLSERISLSDTASELGRLAGVLNSTFARLESAFSQQRQFTADASHELRTPLAVIISEAQTTLARERNSAEYRETIEACLDAAQQMRRLTESLLELARLDAGQESVRREPVPLAELTHDCLELVRPLASQQGLDIETSLEPALTSGDPDRLRQVIINLLGNAIQYNKPSGKIRVTTRSRQERVELEVSDTGQGISSDDLPHVFERFYRADKARSRGDGHSGLGLAISKAIVDAHGGTIQAVSELAHGTTFTVVLPASSGGTT